ncbi:hypothetical protein HCN44_003411 [Aphidius gifuensis]|uniref:Uncharacterized protein n=1 Tax=Aphidius gifuensis TaxID=684658 RepID=A0A834Y0L0_APHGI|nr:hypothetical protein HCN44_003411 [Aphidius gifuensis]
MDVNCIKKFDYKKFKNDEYDPEQTFAIEWRDSVRKPLGGWLLYEAIIIAVSANINVLEKKMNIIDGFQSPDRTINNSFASDNEDNESINFEQDKEETSCNDDSENDIDEDEIIKTNQLSIDLKQCDKQKSSDLNLKNKIDNYKKKKTSEPSINLENDEPEKKSSIENSENDIDELEAKNKRKSSDKQYDTDELETTNKKKSSDKQYDTDKLETTNKRKSSGDHEYVTKADLKSFTVDILTQLGINPTKKKRSSNSMNEDSKNDATPKMKVLKSKDEKHQFEMSYEKWKTAKTRPSYTTMAWSLVLAAFERDTLLRSNYHGGVSKKKNNDGDNNIKLQRLNDNIISIIKG